MTDFEADADYEECVVTFFDILGFRHLLNTRSGAEISDILQNFRRLSETEEIVPAQRVDEVRLQSEAKTEIISDAIVRVRTTETQYASGPLIWEIIDLLHIQIDCLNRGILIRGASTVGFMHLGMNLEGPIFGPGLVQAYEMEENEVIFPRIVIHEDVIKRHRTDSTLWREGHSFAEEERHIQSLLKSDEAGMFFIDYLRASLSEFDDGFVDWVRFLNSHKDLIERGLSEAGNSKVRRKYNWMKRYHNQVLAEYFEHCDDEAFNDDFEKPTREIFNELLID